MENGRYQPGDAVIETVAREYLEPLRQEGLDVLMPGLPPTYPLLTDVIREIMGPEVSLVNAGAESVHTLHDALARRQLLAPEGTGQALLCTSDRPEGFGQMARRFLQEEPTAPGAAGGHRAILRRPSWKEM